MALGPYGTILDYTGDGAETDFAVTFPFIDASHIYVTVEGTETSAWSYVAPNVEFDVAPTNLDEIVIFRDTPMFQDRADSLPDDIRHFQVRRKLRAGIRNTDLDHNFQTVEYRIQELADCTACETHLPANPEENGYDEFLDGLGLALWVKGLNGISNAVSPSLTVTTRCNGFADCDSQSGVGAIGSGASGAGADIDPGIYTQILSFDKDTDWTRIGADHFCTLSGATPGPIEGYLEGRLSEPNSNQWRNNNAHCAPTWEFDWELKLIDMYENIPWNSGWGIRAVIHAQSAVGQVVHDTGFITKANNSPITNPSGTFKNTGSDTWWYVNFYTNTGWNSTDDEVTWGDMEGSVAGHAGFNWHWTENTWTNASSYSFGIISDYSSTRHGLDTGVTQILYQGGATTGTTGIRIYWDLNGDFIVDHRGQTNGLQNFGAKDGNMVVVHDNAANTTKLYIDGVLDSTKTTVSPPAGSNSGVEFIGGSSDVTNSGKNPLSNKFQHLWHLPSALTLTQVEDLFAEVGS